MFTKKKRKGNPPGTKERGRTIRVSYRAASGARTSTGVGMSTLSQTPIAQGLGARLRRGPMAALDESAPCKHLSTLLLLLGRRHSTSFLGTDDGGSTGAFFFFSRII